MKDIKTIYVDKPIIKYRESTPEQQKKIIESRVNKRVEEMK
jgi:hypothetical protein